MVKGVVTTTRWKLSAPLQVPQRVLCAQKLHQLQVMDVAKLYLIKTSLVALLIYSWCLIWWCNNQQVLPPTAHPRPRCLRWRAFPCAALSSRSTATASTATPAAIATAVLPERRLQVISLFRSRQRPNPQQGAVGTISNVHRR